MTCCPVEQMSNHLELAPAVLHLNLCNDGRVLCSIYSHERGSHQEICSHILMKIAHRIGTHRQDQDLDLDLDQDQE